jgi:hypothetical protein
MKCYFSYHSISCCGIPTIQLLGTVEDWVSLRDKALAIIGLTGETAYQTEMKVILDQIVDTVKDTISPLEKSEFWSNLYRMKSGSGFSGVNGWINLFFPYDAKNERLTIDKMKNGKQQWQGCRDNNDFPSSISSTPMVWTVHKTNYNCRLYAGQMGVLQRSDNHYIMPGWAWAIFIE